MSDLPEDTLYYNIFSRIPIKSLVRFRCVCKHWREYIDEYIKDPHLAKIHHAIEEPKPIHIGSIKSYFPFQQPISILSFLRVTEDTVDGIQVEEDLSSIFQIKRSSIHHPNHKIHGYCNGLITLKRQPHQFRDIGTTFEVINPLTKECHELPQLKRPNHERIIGQGLGFDDSTNTFKMVCLFDDNGSVVHVLGTDSWREIPQVPLHWIDGEAVYANGRLYWQTRYANYGFQLVWFDMKKEEFGVIDLPKQTEGWYHLYYPELVNLNGELRFVAHYIRHNDREVVVWILKHDDQWITHCVFKHHNSYGRVSVLGCWNQDGDLLLLSSHEGFLLFLYRLKSGSFHKLIRPEDEAKGGEIRMYQSSLLSIRKWH
uniref:putative F-box protein At2g02030 n=1 Tax=Erigeron canadensis TaxID=72917 RepID=UPI001CB8E8D8|nr:putative F-box protein At2g02030 [Erigeron canadensis]